MTDDATKTDESDRLARKRRRLAMNSRNHRHRQKIDEFGNEVAKEDRGVCGSLSARLNLDKVAVFLELKGYHIDRNGKKRDLANRKHLQDAWNQCVIDLVQGVIDDATPCGDLADIIRDLKLKPWPDRGSIA